MIDAWRTILYPLGFLSGIAFGVRFLVQWLNSEMKGESVVTRSFWHFSITGNVLLFVHSFIQVQYHVCVIQACNAVVAWRNLNLMRPREHQRSLSLVVILLALAVAATSAAFAVQDYFFFANQWMWFRSPVMPWTPFEARNIPAVWHVVGFVGMILFSSRFWVQWWSAEKERTSYLGRAFWWLSLSGAVLTLVYFLRLRDLVNIVGPAFGIVPYVRNLILIDRPRLTATPNKNP